jgi:hypothetical protein
MTQPTIDWTSPEGKTFSFTFTLNPHYEATSVTEVGGEIHISSKANEAEEHQKKHKTEVGYLSGYIIKRNNKKFHYDGDVVCDELHTFTTALYDSSGKVCRVPNSEFSKIPASKGGMFLLEYIEIDPKYKGMDLGINFIYEALNHVKKHVGVCVMDPTTLSEHKYRYQPTWRDLMLTATDERAKTEMGRSFIVKLRRQFYRMGFRPIQDIPKHVNQWYLSLETYKTNQNVKEAWLSKADVKDVHIAMSTPRYIKSENDKVLERVIQGLTQFDSQKKDEINRLERDGASLIGIKALHLAAATYKKQDFFEYLISEKMLPVDSRDENGNTPLHVAAVMDNVVATMFLIEKGAEKRALDNDGQTPMQAVQEKERSMRDFENVMGFSFGMGSGQSEVIKRLLR